MLVFVYWQRHIECRKANKENKLHRGLLRQTCGLIKKSFGTKYGKKWLSKLNEWRGRGELECWSIERESRIGKQLTFYTVKSCNAQSFTVPAWNSRKRKDCHLFSPNIHIKPSLSNVVHVHRHNRQIEGIFISRGQEQEAVYFQTTWVVSM